MKLSLGGGRGVWGEVNIGALHMRFLRSLLRVTLKDSIPNKKN